MKRLKYVPWDLGKKRYTSDPKSFVVKRNNIATAAQNMVQKQTASLTGKAAGTESAPVPTVPVRKPPSSAKKSAQD